MVLAAELTLTVVRAATGARPPIDRSQPSCTMSPISRHAEHVASPPMNRWPTCRRSELGVEPGEEHIQSGIELCGSVVQGEV